MNHLAIDFFNPRIRPMRAGDDLDQRRFARPILSDQRMHGGSSYPEYRAMARDADALTGLAATVSVESAIRAGDDVEQGATALVSGNYFHMLGVEPAVGRAIGVDDDRLSAPVAMISHAYWQREFGGSADAVAVG